MASADPFSQTWFDPDNPGPLHDALRLDFVRVKAAAERRPSLRRHMADCAVCQAIGAAVGSAPSPSSARRRIKLVITHEQMHSLLNLPPHFEIVHMFAENDPNIVSILLAGEGLPEQQSETATLTARLDDVVQDSVNKPS